MISEKKGAFWNPKNQRFHRNRGSFKVKVGDFFNMENTDRLHKFPASGGTGTLTHRATLNAEFECPQIWEKGVLL